MDKYLENKVAVVTGAGSGIGRAIAKKMAVLGATVYCTDMNTQAAQETADQLCRELPSQAHKALYMDVTDRESVDACMKEIGQAHGAIDVLCSNAGVSTMKLFENLTERDWDFNMDVNAKGMFNVTQAALPLMKQKGARVVFTASQAALKAYPYFSHYSASKFAVLALVQSLCVELAPYRINVNCVCPGYVQTSMQERELVWEAELRGMTVEQVKQDYLDHTPFREMCKPEYVADAVGFLVGPEASFLTGIALPVTGGSHLL